MKATYIWQMINQVGRYLPFFSFFLWRFLCVSQQGEFKNTTAQKTFWGKSMSKTFGEKVEICFFLSSFPIFFYRVFGRVSA
jgi:hypothetical protein